MVFDRFRRCPSLIRLPLAAAFLASAAPADAQVRLQPDSGGNFNVGVMSWWEIPFRSIIRQRYDFSCGSAAIATLLTYHYDRPTSEHEAFVKMWEVGEREEIRARGFSLLDMRTYLKSIGYEAEGFRLAVEHLAQVRRPMIALIDLHGYKHFVVIKGMRGDRILSGDPVLGLVQYSTEDFARHWEGIGLAIMKAPDSKRPAYDLASDWGPWSRAPLDEGGGIRIASNDLTNDLPPEYQITPEMLIPVRVGTVE